MVRQILVKQVQLVCIFYIAYINIEFVFSDQGKTFDRRNIFEIGQMII